MLLIQSMKIKVASKIFLEANISTFMSNWNDMRYEAAKFLRETQLYELENQGNFKGYIKNSGGRKLIKQDCKYMTYSFKQYLDYKIKSQF